MKFKKTNINQILLPMLALLTLATVSVHAAPKSAKSVIEKASTHAKTIPSFEMEVELKLIITSDGDTSEQEVGYYLAYQRPDKFAVRVEDADITLSMYSDNSGTTHYLEEFNQYILKKEFTPPVELVGSMANPQLSPALSFIGEYANKVPFEALLKGDSEITFVGEETINEIQCDRIRVQYKGQAIDAWFSQGAAPVLQRVVPEVPELLKRIKEYKKTEDVQLLVQCEIQKWTFDGDIISAVKFTPTESMEKVASFHKPVPAMMLKGKPAPDVKLTSLKDEPFDLSTKIGKEVIVLDFWATWCGPCRIGMPILAKVTKEFENKGVSLYTINSSDSPEAIQEYLKDAKLDVTVLLDPTYKASETYKADKIPLTIIIGKDGTVQKVHGGLNPATYEAELRAELTELTQ